MPELPEVQTTVNGLNRIAKGRTITGVWTDYKSAHKMFSQSIKSPFYFKKFKKLIVGAKILSARRRAKNILIDLSNGETILIHMKMTGHMMYGKYRYTPPSPPLGKGRMDAKQTGGVWRSIDTNKHLLDPFNQFIHFVITLDNGKHLAFSDLRKFAKISVIETDEESESIHLLDLGPEPLEKKFQFPMFKSQLMRRAHGKIKQVLMDQCVIAGIGNIYSDEILWRAGVHPLSLVGRIPEKQMKLMFTAMKAVLKEGIDFGGDSTSDYRDIRGEPGKFQSRHEAYRRTGKKCSKDKGIIKRIVVGGRSAHFCPVHQTLYA